MITINNYSYNIISTVIKSLFINLIVCLAITVLGSVIHFASKESISKIGKIFSHEFGYGVEVWHLMLPFVATVIFLYSLFSTRRFIPPSIEETDNEEAERHLDNSTSSPLDIPPAAEPSLNPISPLLQKKGYRYALVSILRNPENLKKDITSVKTTFDIESEQLVLNHMLLTFVQNHLLFTAGQSKNIKKTLLTLKNEGANFTYLDDLGYKNTPLMWAIANADNEVASLLIPIDSTAIHIASSNGMTPLILTIAKGYRIKSQDGQLLNPNNSELAEQLITAGANVNQSEVNGYTPLHFAVMHRNTALITILLAQGANPNVTNNEGLTPLKMLDLTHDEIGTILEKLCPAYERTPPPDQDEIIRKLLLKSLHPNNLALPNAEKQEDVQCPLENESPS